MDLKKLIAYDSWANNKVFEAIAASEVKNADSFDEIRKLFSHILAAQQVWLNRMNNEVPEIEIWPDLSLSDISDRLGRQSQQLQQQVQNSGGNIHYTNSAGTAFSNTVDEILNHLVIHGQHHRAQIARLLREAGAEPPTTDLIFYLRTH